MGDVAKGELKPFINKVYSLDHVADAHRYMEPGDFYGKIVLINK
ncbi:zinc-binding dehydrogenase [Providencia vermicola]